MLNQTIASSWCYYQLACYWLVKILVGDNTNKRQAVSKGCITKYLPHTKIRDPDF